MGLNIWLLGLKQSMVMRRCALGEVLALVDAIFDCYREPRELYFIYFCK